MILTPLTDEEINETFTHVGRYAGIIPVYLSTTDEEIARMDGEESARVFMRERNGWPGWILPVTWFIHSIFTMWYPRPPSLVITGEIGEE